MRTQIATITFLAASLAFTTAVMAQEERHEIGVQGTGSFTRDPTATESISIRRTRAAFSSTTGTI